MKEHIKKVQKLIENNKLYSYDTIKIIMAGIQTSITITEESTNKKEKQMNEVVMTSLLALLAVAAEDIISGGDNISKIKSKIQERAEKAANSDNIQDTYMAVAYNNILKDIEEILE